MKAFEKEAIYTVLSHVQDLFEDGYIRTRKKINFTDDVISHEISGPDITLNKSNDTLVSINDSIYTCVKCRLSATRRHHFFGIGNKESKVFIVLDSPLHAPSKGEETLIGEAGILLEKMLTAISLDIKTECFISSVVKCFPSGGREPTRDEQSDCGNFLERQIACVKPNVIIAFGRVAAQFLLDSTEPLSKLRCGTHLYHDIPVFVTFSPLFLLREPTYKRQAWDDLKLLKEHLNG